MKQFILGLVLGASLVGGLVWAQSNPYWQMTPMEKQQFDREQMLEYNFNRALQQHNYQQPLPHPC